MFLSFYVRAQAFWATTRERLAGERGAVATEYALLLLLIAIAIVAAATALGKAVSGKFTSACNSLGGANC